MDQFLPTWSVQCEVFHLPLEVGFGLTTKWDLIRQAGHSIVSRGSFPPCIVRSTFILNDSPSVASVRELLVSVNLGAREHTDLITSNLRASCSIFPTPSPPSNWRQLNVYYDRTHFVLNTSQENYKFPEDRGFFQSIFDLLFIEYSHC